MAGKEGPRLKILGLTKRGAQDIKMKIIFIFIIRKPR